MLLYHIICLTIVTCCAGCVHSEKDKVWHPSVCQYVYLFRQHTHRDSAGGSM